MDSIFKYKTNDRPVVYPQANGPNYGFSFIIDTHTRSSVFKKQSNTNKKVDVVIHEGEDIPYFKYVIGLLIIIAKSYLASNMCIPIRNGLCVFITRTNQIARFRSHDATTQPMRITSDGN